MRSIQNQDKKKSISVVILNWNGFEDTVECLRSFFDQDYPYTYIYVVDNHSKNSEAQRLHDLFGNRIEIIKSDSNLGYCGGNNLAIRRILRAGMSDFIFLANNDIVLEKDHLSVLVKWASRFPDGGFFGGKTYIYGSDLLYCAYGKINKFRGDVPVIGFKEKDKGQHDHAQKVPYINGHALFIRVEALKKTGLFDEMYFAYNEETDLQIRGKLQGFHSYYIPKAICSHKISRSTHNHSNFRSYLISRNRFLFMRKNYPAQYPCFLIYYLMTQFPLKLAGCLFRLFIRKDPRPFRFYLLSLRFIWKPMNQAVSDNVMNLLK